MAKNKRIPTEKKKPKTKFSVKLLKTSSDNPLKRIVLKFSKIAAKKRSKKPVPSVAKQNDSQEKRQRFDEFDLLYNTSPPEKQQRTIEEILLKYPNCRRRLFVDSPKKQLKLKLKLCKGKANEYFIGK